VKRDSYCLKFAFARKNDRHGFKISLLLQNKYKEYSRVREAEEAVDDLKHVVTKRYVIRGQCANYLFA